MMPDSNAAGSFYLSCCWTVSYLIFLLFLRLPLTPALPCVADEQLQSYVGGVHDNLDSAGGCGSYEESSSIGYGVQRSSLGCAGLLHRCSHSESFCFLSTLADGEENCKKSYTRSSGNSNRLGWMPSHAMLYKLSNGREVTCSSLGTESVISDGLPTETVNADRDDSGMCKGPLVPVGWVIKSSLGAARHGTSSLKIDNSIACSSLHVIIDPPFLDWGTVNLYSPSVSFLTVTNSHNDSILHVYEPFSTDPQFYVQGFRELSLTPGETATVAFVFLPKQLGTSAAHLVLQTSFGGFVVNAKGLAVDSPFRVQLVTEVNASGTGNRKNLSLYNPYNKSLRVEEVTVWFSLASGNVSHTSHISCHINDISHDSSDIPIESVDSDKDTLERSRDGMSWVGLIPHNKWELSPDETETVLKITILPYFEGKGVGAICVRLHDSSQTKTELFMIPIEEEVNKKVGFHTFTDSVSAFLEPWDICGDGGSTFFLSLRNDVSELLQLVKVIEVTESRKLFHIRYVEDMLLYPGSLTHVALITHVSHSELDGMSNVVPQQNIDCKLRIMTNDSANSQIDIPCQDLLHSCSRQGNKFEPAVSIDSQLGSSTKSTDVKDKDSFGNLIERDFQLKPYLFDVLEADELILEKWKSQSTVIGRSILEDHELTFSTVEVGNYAEKWITLKNPSERPVVAQLILNSGVIIDHCKSVAPMSCHFFSKSSPGNPIVHVEGFSFLETAVIGASIPPFGSSTLGPVLFHPSDRCMWRGSALIRNNLSGVEWLPLKGSGGLKSLVLFEDSQPVKKLEFNLDWLLPLNLSVEPKFGKDISSSACSSLVSKELLLRNTGELPFEVVKLQVSGNSCELDGFRIHGCKGFALEPGESMKLHISYQPDFTDYVVDRDLELALASGKIVIPMKVNIPVYMVKLCQRRFVWSFLRILLLITFIAFAITAMFIGLPHVSSVFYGSTMMKSNIHTIIPNSQVVKPAKIQRNPSNSRSNRDDVKPSEGYMGRSPDGKNSQGRNASVQFEKDMTCEEKVPMISHHLEEKPTEEARKCGSSDNFQSSNLTVKIVKEKVKKKKKRSSGVGAVGLAAKNDVSSSQSGNSTPSSPLSPNAFTPKKVWPSSSEPIEISTNRNSSERKEVSQRSENLVKNRVPGSSIKAMSRPAVIKCDQEAWQKVNHERVLHQKPSPKPVLTPSATFPSSSWRAPGVAPMFRASASPIAPHARAPGSNLNRDKAVKRDEGIHERKDFTYDIWGNHLCDHIMGRSKDKELSPRALSDASEGDSLSFFARGPQSLMKMSSLRSESPDPKPPSFGVNYNHQMV